MRWPAVVTLVAACNAGGGRGPGEAPPACGGGVSCDANLTTDPHNCGWCAHDCGGMGCSDGVCDPIVLDSSVVGSMVSDGTSIFYSADAIWKIPVNGGTRMQLASASGGALTVAGDNLYFTAGDLEVVSKNGGPVRSLATSPHGVSGLALTATDAYFMDIDAATSIAQLERVPLAGGSIETVATMLGPGLPNTLPRAVLAVDADAAYFTGGCSVYRQLLSGGPWDTLATNACPLDLAIDADFVYYSHLSGPSPGHVYRVPRGGGSPQDLALAAPIGAVLVDGDTLFWADIKGILAAPKNGGNNCRYFKEEVGNIAVDNRFVYTYKVNTGLVQTPR